MRFAGFGSRKVLIVLTDDEIYRLLGVFDGVVGGGTFGSPVQAQGWSVRGFSDYMHSGCAMGNCFQPYTLVY